MKRIKLGSLVLLSIIFVFVVASCSSSKPPKEAIVSAMTKMQDAKTMSFKGALALDELVMPESATNAETTAVVKMFKGATINMRGVVQKEPQRMEITFDVAFDLDGMKFNLSVPMIMTKDKMWMKIPGSSFLPLPPTVTGKFVEFDLKKMMEEQGASAVPDVKETQKLAQDILKTVLENFDEKTYFSEPKAEDVKGLPEGFKADRFIRFSIKQDNFDKAVTAIVNQIAPKVIDLLIQNESYAKSLKLTKEDLEKAKKELAGQGDAEVKKAIEKIKKNLKINEFSMTGGIQDGYLVYEDVRANADFVDGQDTTKVGAHLTLSYDNINKDVKFEYELPKDAIPYEKFQEMTGGAAGGM